MPIELSYQSPFKLKHVKRIKQLLINIAQNEGYAIKNLSIVFTSDDFLLNINRQYLKHDYYTDIITFDYNMIVTNAIYGELFISIDRAKENAVTFSITLDQEILRLLIHGILHLCGYTDDNFSSKQIMTRLENNYLQTF
jgi:rRNA maturation RNase YbeY